MKPTQLILWTLVMTLASLTAHGGDSLIIDDRSSGDLSSKLGTAWRLVSDNVMGGVSAGRLTPTQQAGRDCLRLQGEVSTRNNGGFVQMVLELADGEAMDASAFDAVEIEVAGNGERYNLHLRTTDLWLPWQSYRAEFTATPEWQRLRIPFRSIRPYRTGKPFRADHLKRIGVVAIGRDFQADVCLASVSLRKAQAN